MTPGLWGISRKWGVCILAGGDVKPFEDWSFIRVAFKLEMKCRKSRGKQHLPCLYHIRTAFRNCSETMHARAHRKQQAVPLLRGAAKFSLSPTFAGVAQLQEFPIQQFFEMTD